MTNDPGPRRALGPDDAEESADSSSHVSPSRAWMDDDEPTVIRRLNTNFDRYQNYFYPQTSAGPAATDDSDDDGPISVGSPSADPESLVLSQTVVREDGPDPAGRHIAGTAAALDDDRRLRTSMALTVASAVIPGSGLLAAPQIPAKILGAITTAASVAGGLFLVWFVLNRTGDAAALAGNTTILRTASLVLIAVALAWVALITLTHLLTRPGNMRMGRRLVGAVLVAGLAFAVAAPTAVAARYARDQTMLVEKVFKGGDDEVQSTSRPTLAEEGDPWEGIPRVNILLLGADGGLGREEMQENYGVRTDTIMVASIDTKTGDTMLVQVPRNVQFTPFPVGSEMREVFPEGFRGENELDWHVNSIWPKVELEYPDLFVGSTYRGAEALKQGIQGITGLKIDYFAMLNMDGLQELIDAMGGVTVNISQRLAIGGDTQGRKPSGYLEIGPDQHLDGYHALWYARSRRDFSDYDRMARQSCLVDAVIKQANPTNLLTRFEAIASASGDMLLTDIPQRDLDDIIKLAFRVKDGTISRLVFSEGKNGYEYYDPDFVEMRRAVRVAINPPPPSSASASPDGSGVSPTASASESMDVSESPEEEPSVSPSASETGVLTDGTQTVTDVCGFNPPEGWEPTPADDEEE